MDQIGEPFKRKGVVRRCIEHHDVKHPLHNALNAVLSGKPVAEYEPAWIERLKFDLSSFPFHKRSKIPDRQTLKATRQQFIGR